MRFTKKKVAALALSTLFLCGALSGCDLVTKDQQKNLLQVVAEVNIAKSEDFQNKYAAYKDVIGTEEILKRDLVASYLSVGYQYVNNYGYSEKQAYEQILSSLVNRRIYLQYAKTYFLENDASKTVSGYQASTANISDELEKQIAGLAYFLSEDEIKQAEYTIKKTFNNTIDSQEKDLITLESDDKEYDTARTTPTGINTEKDDYYDEAYDIYTGTNALATCGSYEAVEGSTSATRRRAYGQFLASLESYSLLKKGENVSDITKISYYRLEIKNAYEDALVNKLTEAFETEAKAKMTQEWIKEKYEATYETQKKIFDDNKNKSTFEKALDSVSDSSFVFYAPNNEYGFVINILLPFSTTQQAQLDSVPADYGEKQGNKFVERAKLLKNVKATDQRNTWFTCEDEYSYKIANDEKAFTNGQESRKYLFFENEMNNTNRYEPIKNYYGQYTFNGTVTKDSDDDYVIKPNEIDIDGFIGEMESYLKFAGFETEAQSYNVNGDYYSKSVSDYYGKDGEVDYSAFVYYEGKVEKDGTPLSETFDANKVFVAGSNENTAMSVINELSFAYNTDTAGLNSYLGYKVSPENTDYVKEFEYAAQLAVRGGPGTYVVAPSTYGWHIMYCTFSYKKQTPYTFDWNDIDTKGSFSNLYYESLKASNFSTYATDLQTQIMNDFHNDTCVETYEKRYSDLFKN